MDYEAFDTPMLNIDIIPLSTSYRRRCCLANWTHVIVGQRYREQVFPKQISGHYLLIESF